MVSKNPYGRGVEAKRRVGDTKSGHTGGFAKTGKARPAQFAPNSPGQKEKGFTQWSEKQVTAAMQGKPASFAETKAKPKNNGSKQFSNAPGKAVF